MMRLLVVEDEYMIAMALKQDLERLGVEVVGPVGRPAKARALAEEAPLDGALLDINLNNGDSFEVAEIMQRRGLPFAFVTGYGAKRLPHAFRDAPRLAKPVQQRQLREVLEGFANRPQ